MWCSFQVRIHFDNAQCLIKICFYFPIKHLKIYSRSPLLGEHAFPYVSLTKEISTDRFLAVFGECDVC